ncbi:MAG: tetratricopeptide repeat protein [Flavobacteriaceae bacterium]|nr:tetratricopeptide repeat protein [Flavobacteriaceae bacterium]
MRLHHFLYLLIFSYMSFGQDFQKAYQLQEGGKTNQAIKELKLLIDQQPNNKKALSLAGEIYSKQENWEEASNYYKKLVELEPKNADYNFKYGGSLGLYAKSVNKFKAVFLVEDVKKYLNLAAELDSEHVEVRWALIQLYLELPSIIGGSVEKAKQYAKELEKVSPVDGALTNGIIAEEEKDFSTAENYYKNAIAIGNSKLTYQKLVELYLKTDQLQKAKEIAQKAYKETSEKDFLKQVRHLN